jgi:hypothetical protein
MILLGYFKLQKNHCIWLMFSVWFDGFIVDFPFGLVLLGLNVLSITFIVMPADESQSEWFIL